MRVVTELGACDAIVHSAALLDKEPLAIPVAMTNCVGTPAALWVAGRLGAAHFVYISGVKLARYQVSYVHEGHILGRMGVLPVVLAVIGLFGHSACSPMSSEPRAGEPYDR